MLRQSAPGSIVAQIDRYWDKLLEGGKPMACGWLTDKFGLCWQLVPEKIGESFAPETEPA